MLTEARPREQVAQTPDDEAMIDLSDRSALVTGAARGIGRATAVALAEAGARVIASDLDKPTAGLTYDTAEPSDLNQTVSQITESGGQAVAAFADVRDVNAQRGAVALAVERWGRLDIVVANAGIASWPETTWQATEEQWQTMIDVTLTGTWNTCRAAIPAIIDGGRGGAIVIVSSSAALKPVATIGHYAAAKAGLVGLMKSLALELASVSIRVNTVHPGGTATEMTQNSAAEHWQATAPGVAGALELPLPIHRMEPRDIAAAIRWLCSDEARYVTGTTQLIDAGALLR
jgi:SDR family mycofactocin-dependent oxidoreductase